MVSLCPIFPLIFGMFFLACFLLPDFLCRLLIFYVASSRLHFGSRFFFPPQPFSAAVFFWFTSVPQLWVCFRCVDCVFPLLVDFIVFFTFSRPRWHGGDVEAWASISDGLLGSVLYSIYGRVYRYIYIYIYVRM